jgi:hypothetical protein
MWNSAITATNRRRGLTRHSGDSEAEEHEIGRIAQTCKGAYSAEAIAGLAMPNKISTA